MSEDAEKKIGYINDALGGAYENTPNGEVTIGTRVKDMDKRLGYVEKALGDAYDPETDTTIGDRVKNTEADMKATRAEVAGLRTDLQKIAVGGIDYEALAKAINDDADCRARDDNPDTGPRT